MLKILVDIDIPYIKGVFEPFAQVEYHKGSDITNDKVLDADALIVRTRTRCNDDFHSYNWYRSYRSGIL